MVRSASTVTSLPAGPVLTVTTEDAGVAPPRSRAGSTATCQSGSSSSLMVTVNTRASPVYSVPSTVTQAGSPSTSGSTRTVNASSSSSAASSVMAMEYSRVSTWT